MMTTTTTTTMMTTTTTTTTTVRLRSLCASLACAPAFLYPVRSLCSYLPCLCSCPDRVPALLMCLCLVVRLAFACAPAVGFRALPLLVRLSSLVGLRLLVRSSRLLVRLAFACGPAFACAPAFACGAYPWLPVLCLLARHIPSAFRCEGSDSAAVGLGRCHSSPMPQPMLLATFFGRAHVLPGDCLRDHHGELLDGPPHALEHDQDVPSPSHRAPLHHRPFARSSIRQSPIAHRPSWPSGFGCTPYVIRHMAYGIGSGGKQSWSPMQAWALICIPPCSPLTSVVICTRTSARCAAKVQMLGYVRLGAVLCT